MRIFLCDTCNKECVRANWEFKRTEKHYCSHECAVLGRTRSSYPQKGDKKFSLTFIEAVEKERGITYFRCLCDCGEITEIQRNKFGITQTCNIRKNHKGKQHPMFKGYQEISSSYWNSVIHGAEVRNLPFDISIEYAWDKFVQQDRRCALSGEFINLDKNFNKEITASLDRIDSSLGYTPDNIQWVHKQLNKLKWDTDENEFKEWCKKVYLHSGLREYLDFDDVLIKPKKSSLRSRNEVDLFKNAANFNSIPIIAANIDTIGTFSMANALMDYGLMTCLHKYYPVQSYIDFYNSLPENRKSLVFLSVGATNKDIDKLQRIVDQVEITNICLDVANAYTPIIPETIEKIRAINQNCVLMVGNIATPEIISEFAKLKVDIVKCGIGPGGVCTTRKMTGIGVPQFSCVIECAQEASQHGIRICSDGGCRSPADIVKAFAAGASMVMVGSMLSGCDECEATWKDIDGKKEMDFYGMSSKIAMEKYSELATDYRASEGKLVKVPYRGPVSAVVKDILGGLRSACTYVGASSLRDLSKNSQFIKVHRTHNAIFGI